MPLHKHETLFHKVYNPIEKGLRVAEGVIQGVTLAKSVWDVGSKIVAGARVAAGAAAVLL